VLVGRLCGFPTPVNAFLQGVANEAARRRQPPGEQPAGEALALLESSGALQR
jgi:hypothetical protein